MNYEINFSQYRHNFSLPASVVEDHLKEIDSDYLKVILLIFKNPDKNYSTGLLSNLLNLSPSKVEKAIGYWVKKGVLLGDSQAVPEQVHTVSKTAVTSAAPICDTELKYLLSSVEGLLQRPATSADVKTLTYIYEYYRLPADVILMAIQYAVERGKDSIKYIESVCIGWYDQGIVTHTQAEEYLQRMSKEQEFEGIIKKMFGISGRKLIASEEKFIASWFEKYHFPLDMIQLAYEKTVQNTGKVAFAYTNKILLNWNKKGFSTLQDVLENEGAKGYSTHHTGTRSYDIEEFEKYLDEIPKLDD
ncbi:MAG: DnaD domain protein [Massiliimalia sp.]